MNHFSRACDNFGFTINTKKTEVMHQPAPRNIYHEPHIFVNDETLKATDSFTYLLCIWKTQEESMGPTRNQPRHQAKGIHGCGANYRPANMHVSHGLCTLPSKMFADYFEHH